MSELLGGPSGNGRASNGGARTAAGPVPVREGVPASIRTPRDIMNQRNAREARRQAEADALAKAAAEEKRQQEEARRRSAERRAAAAGVTGQAWEPTTGAQRPAGLAPPSRPVEAGYGGEYTGAGASQHDRHPPTTGGPVNPPPQHQTQEGYSDSNAYSRPRVSSQAQPQPRPGPAYNIPAQPASVPDPRQEQSTSHQQAHSRQPSMGGAAPTPAVPGQSRSSQNLAGAHNAQASQSRNPTVSSFPHAFERWEQLSSHWEGLTSFWLRRLEQNSEEMRNEPLARQMSRQITDLSAAGANLFHAVVELQRLRASSERRFQRWFFETRAEQERLREVNAGLERALMEERERRAEVNTDQIRRERESAEKMVAEMRRELAISKEEARRAWEELGRREQEERDKMMALREGQPTFIGGVQVVPMTGMVSRQHSTAQRPQTRDSPGSYPTGAQVHQAMGSQGAQGGPGSAYRYTESQSPTNTDPFMESGNSMMHDPTLPSLGRGDVTYPAIPMASTPGVPSESGAVHHGQAPAPLQPHQHATGSSQSHPQSQQEQDVSQPAHFYQHAGTYLPGGRTPLATADTDEPQSPGLTEEDDEEDDDWVVDEFGNYVRDADGNRIRYENASQASSGAASDDYNAPPTVVDDRREGHYGTTQPSAATTTTGHTTTGGANTRTAGPSSAQTQQQQQPSSQQQQQQYGPPSAAAASSPAPDYSGEGYGDEWASLRHHHPTRLSDVIEEEDERSRTSPSRASQTSRGMY